MGLETFKLKVEIPGYARYSIKLRAKMDRDAMRCFVLKALCDYGTGIK